MTELFGDYMRRHGVDIAVEFIDYDEVEIDRKIEELEADIRQLCRILDRARAELHEKQAQLGELKGVPSDSD